MLPWQQERSASPRDLLVEERLDVDHVVGVVGGGRGLTSTQSSASSVVPRLDVDHVVGVVGGPRLDVDQVVGVVGGPRRMFGTLSL